MNTVNLTSKTMFIVKDEGVVLSSDIISTLGLHIEDSRYRWCTAIGPEVTDMREGNEAVLSGTLSDGLEYHAGGDELILNSSDYFREGKGIHITVYDPEIRKVVDEVCFEYDGTSWKAVRD